MRRYIIKRIILAVITLFAVSALTFFIMNAIPGGPFNYEKAATPAVRAVLEQRFDLDKPLVQQYLIYINNFLRGDFGISLKSGRSISATLFGAFAVSAKIGVPAAAVAAAGGIFLGCLAAARHNRFTDKVILTLTSLGAAVPSFILATLLLILFCYKLQLVPVWSAEQSSLILPIAALAIYPMAYTARLTRAAVLDALSSDFIKAARGRGLSRRSIVLRHALKAALPPVVTYLGPMCAYIITGSLVVESVFTIGGLGTVFISAITASDYPLIMAITIFLAALVIAANLVCDIACKIIDRRIELE